jgi:hypothetical protein
MKRMKARINRAAVPFHIRVKRGDLCAIEGRLVPPFSSSWSDDHSEIAAAHGQDQMPRSCVHS